jgi:hypothetical protein
MARCSNAERLGAKLRSHPSGEGMVDDQALRPRKAVCEALHARGGLAAQRLSEISCATTHPHTKSRQFAVRSDRRHSLTEWTHGPLSASCPADE